MNRNILSIAAAVSLATTSLAQGPGQPNEGSRITRDSANNVITLSWWGRNGQSYFVQHSDDLRLWSYIPQVVQGQDAVAMMQLSTNAPSYYLRLEYEPTSLNLDSDADGIPNSWEVLHGLNPHDPNDAFTMAPGGLSYWQKYILGLNPAIADSDGDLVPDNLDMYPGDPRRTDAIPAKFYAVTELSAYLPDAVKASFDMKQIALDDNHNVAFFGTSDSATGYADVGHVYQWQNGTLAEFRTFPVNQSSYSSSLGYAFSSLYVNGINTLGSLATATETNYDGVNGYDRFWTPWPLTAWPTSPAGDYPTDERKYGEQIAVNRAGAVLAWDLQWQSNILGYRYRTLFKGSGGGTLTEIPVLSDGSSQFPYPRGRGLGLYGLNERGTFLAITSDISYTTRDYWYFEASNLRHALQGIEQIRGTAGAHQAIGGYWDATAAKWKSWFAVETSAGVWIEVPLLDLLKWTGKPAGARDDWDKYHNALRNIRITQITEPDPATAGVVIAGRAYANGVPAYIRFSAETAKDNSDGTPGNNAWTQREFSMEPDSDGHYHIAQVFTTSEDENGNPMSASDPLFLTNRGAALTSSTINQDRASSRLIYEVRFEARNIYRGFDPPMVGDPLYANPPNTDYDPANGKKPLEWWTVAGCPSQTSGTIGADTALLNKAGAYAPAALITNDDIIWRFDPKITGDSALRKFRAEAAGPAAGGSIRLSTAGTALPLTTMTPMVLTGQTAGGGGGDGTGRAILNIRALDGTNQPMNEKAASLNVDVLPVRYIKIGLWYLVNTNTGNEAGETPAPMMMNVAATLARLNQIFRQACIQFVPVNFDANGIPIFKKFTAPYGHYTANGIWELNMMKETEMEEINNLALPGAKMHLLLVRNTIPSGTFGVTPNHITPGPLNDTRDRCVVGTLELETMITDAWTKELVQPQSANKIGGSLAFYDDCFNIQAHEVGHAMELSTRNDMLLRGNPLRRHDQGMFPKYLYCMDGTPVSDPLINPPVFDAVNTPVIPWSAVNAQGKKRRIEWGLMSHDEAGQAAGQSVSQIGPGSALRSWWIRHEDWLHANKNAAKFE